MSDDIPEVEILPMRSKLNGGKLAGVSALWLVPLAALALALVLVWQNMAARGPLIHISFDDAAGIEAGSTQLRYRDVAVGLVEEVGFTDGLEQVRVAVRLNKDVAAYVDADAAFWTVRPQVTAQGISGLDTVLSGAYIAGSWDSAPGGLADDFAGLTVPPLLSGGREGLQFILHAQSGGLTSHAPLLFNGVEVGRLGAVQVSVDDLGVEAPAVVFAPYDQLVTEQTRFWDSSGFSLSVGAGGAALNVESLSALLGGGISFDRFVSDAALANTGSIYEVFGSRNDAHRSIFDRDSAVPLLISAVFEEQTTALSVGAPVQLDGVDIGKVISVDGVIDQARYGDNHVRLLAQMELKPEALGLTGEAAPALALVFLEDRVRGGLRARLATQNVLTGAALVEFVRQPGAPFAQIEQSIGGAARVPVTAATLRDAGDTARDTLARIEALPIEALFARFAGLADQASGVLAGLDENSTLMNEARGALREIGRAADAIRAFARVIERRPNALILGR
ncbi:MAG: MCE family protein [Rhodobacteraceae bacterium]|nr:MCE family protein [Paracoccaceae bacterium]